MADADCPRGPEPTDAAGALRALLRDAPRVGDRYRAANGVRRVVDAVCTDFILVVAPDIPGPGGVAALHRPGWRATIAAATELARSGEATDREER